MSIMQGKKLDFTDIPKIVEMISCDEVSHGLYKGEKVALDQPFEADDKSKRLAVYAKNQAGETVLVR